MTQQVHKLSIFEKVGYGFGDGASNLIWMMFIYFQLNFYTDTFGLTAGAAAAILLWPRLWDAARLQIPMPHSGPRGVPLTE